MYMTDEEIRRDHREANDKKKQIEILADMNATSKREIKEKLTELGEIKPARNSQVAEGDADCHTLRARNDTKVGEARVMDELRAMRLYEEGLDDIEMADALGVKEEKIKAWRRRMKLKRKTGRKAITACGGAPMPREQEEWIATPSCATVRNDRTGDGQPQQSADCLAMTEETEASETKERMTVERMLTIMERLASAGLGKCPLQITGGKINDISAVTVMLHDGRIEVDLTEM